MSLVGFAIVFAAAVLVSYLSTFWVKRLAEWVGCIDFPNERKLHLVATPRLGGLSIILGFVVPLLALTIYPPARALVSKNLDYLFAVLASGSIIIALGVYDDLFGSNAPKKFLFQSIAAVILIAFGFRFQTLSLGVNFDLGILGPVLTVVWIVGVINAINFVDGLDGLATVVTLTIAVFFGIISFVRGDVFSLVITTALAGSLMGFFPWNRPPAKIFMGDTGSQFIGLLLAAVSIARHAKSPVALVIAGPFLALALPVIDTLVVMKGRFFQPDLDMAQRFFGMFNADRSHFHHVLVAKYGSPLKAIFFVWLVTVVFGAAGVLTVIDETRRMGYVVAFVAVLLMIALRAGRKASDGMIDAPLDDRSVADDAPSPTGLE